MNLNINSLDLNEISQETQDKYSFPSDKIKDITLISKGELREHQQLLVNKTEFYGHLVLGLSVIFGLSSVYYIQTQLPGGVAIRMHKDSKLTFLQRWRKRAVPFLCFLIPFNYARNLSRNSYQYS